MKWRLIFIIFFCFILYTLYFIPVARAASEFSSSYNFIYEVSESGFTKVTQKISLTNLTTNYYASEYTLTIGSDEISHVLASDRLGPLKTEVVFENGTTVIHVFFNEKVLGIGKILEYQLNYNSTAVAKHEGKIWRINLPKAFKNESFIDYNVKLAVPAVWGEPSYVKPKPKINYFWTKEEKAQEGISLIFGNWQNYQFSLNYELKNSSFVPQIKEIKLPSTSSTQEIILESLNPNPGTLNVNPEGNWLASYFLWPKQNLKIKVLGYAKVYVYPFTISGLNNQSEVNFISEIPNNLENKFSLEKESQKTGLWQKIWKTLFLRL